MNKFTINVEQKLRFNHRYKVELPIEVDNEKVWCEIGKADHIDDVTHIVEKYGGKVIEFIEDGSGDCELEVDDVI